MGGQEPKCHRLTSRLKGLRSDSGFIVGAAFRKKCLPVIFCLHPHWYRGHGAFLDVHLVNNLSGTRIQ